MGIPYSKQINAAFDQVTPLVAAGFEVLETTKNISLLLFAIQVITVILLGFILAALFAILITINPELENERQALVTPVIKSVASWTIRASHYWTSLRILLICTVAFVCYGAYRLVCDTAEATIEAVADGAVAEATDGEDIEAIKAGKSTQ